jgi:hypothetical protein
MMITVLVLPADISKPPYLQQLETGDMAGFQDIVGGPIEPIVLPDVAATLYTSRDGQHSQPYNLRAITLVWAHLPALRGRTALVNDAYLAGIPAGDGTHTTVPGDLVTLFLRARLFRTQARYGTQRWVNHPRIFDDLGEAYTTVLHQAAHDDQMTAIRVIPAGH